MEADLDESTYNIKNSDFQIPGFQDCKIQET